MLCILRQNTLMTVPIKYCADELRRQQKEEKALLEAAQAMASY